MYFPEKEDAMKLLFENLSYCYFRIKNFIYIYINGKNR